MGLILFHVFRVSGWVGLWFFIADKLSGLLAISGRTFTAGLLSVLVFQVMESVLKEKSDSTLKKIGVVIAALIIIVGLNYFEPPNLGVGVVDFLYGVAKIWLSEWIKKSNLKNTP